MKFLTIFLMAVALTACSGKPSDSDIKALYIEDAMKGKDPTLSVIENFVKVNGYQKDERTYIADVTYDIVFKKSYDDLAKETRAGGDLGKMLSVEALGGQIGRFKVGHKMSYTAKPNFIKTEKGWILQE